MNIFHKITLQSLRRSRTRTLVTVVGVMLSTALITGVATFGVSLLDYLARGAINKYGDWQVAFWNVPTSFIQTQADNPEVAHTAIVQNIGYVYMSKEQNLQKPYLYIAGYNQEAFATLPIYLVSGRLPENSNEIIVSGSITMADGMKISEGDALTLSIGNRMNGEQVLWQQDAYLFDADSELTSETFFPTTQKVYTVVGICRTPSYIDSDAPGYTLITATDETSLCEANNLFVTLKNPRKVHSYINNTGESYSNTLNHNVLRFMGLSDEKLFNMLLYSVGGIVLIIIMIGSIFLIYNAFHISLNERTHQFGILSSVGATEKQLRNSVLFEGLCIGAIGIPSGIIVGIVSIGAVIAVVANNFQSIVYNEVPLRLTVSAPVLLMAAAVSMTTILISAYLPARKAASTPIMECIRQINEIKVDVKSIKTSGLTQHLYGLEGALALKNFKRNKRRYRSIVLSLALSVVLFIATSSFVNYMKQTASSTTEFTTLDISFFSQTMTDAEMLSLYKELIKADGVTDSLYQAILTTSCFVETDKLCDTYWKYAKEKASGPTVSLPINVQFLDDFAYANIIQDLNLPLDEYSGSDAKGIAVAKIIENDNMLQEVDQFADLFTDTTVNLTLAPKSVETIHDNGEHDLTITLVNIVPPDNPPLVNDTTNASLFFHIILPYSSVSDMVFSEEAVDAKGMNFSCENPAKTMAHMKSIIEGFAPTADYTILNMHEMLDENRNMIFIANVFSYTFIVLISLIAVANVFNTISTNIKLRRRELAMLRSVGMSEQAFQKMMNFECFFYGMRALFLGLPIAFLSSWLIYKGMIYGGSDHLNFMIPWGSMMVSVLCVLLIVFITMLYSVSKIKKENIIDALRDDME